MTEYMLNNKFNDPFNKVSFGVSIGEQNQLNEFSKILRGGSKMVEVDIASVYGLHGERGGSAATIGKEEREAIANMAKVNDVDLSIHAPWAINFSGINPDYFGSVLYDCLFQPRFTLFFFATYQLRNVSGWPVYYVYYVKTV